MFKKHPNLLHPFPLPFSILAGFRGKDVVSCSDHWGRSVAYSVMINGEDAVSCNDQRELGMEGVEGEGGEMGSWG